MHGIVAAAACVVLTVTQGSPANTVRVAICQMQVDDGRIADNLARAETCAARARGQGAAITPQ